MQATAGAAVRGADKERRENTMQDKKKRRARLVGRGIYIVVLAAVITCAVKVVWHWEAAADMLSGALGIVFPFLMGLFIAYMINPLVELLNKKLFKGIFRIKKKGLRKGLSVLVAYTIVISLITTMLFYIIPQIVESLMQLTHFIESAQTGYNKIVDAIENLNHRYPEWKLNTVIDFIDNIPEQMEKYLGDIAVTVLPKIYTTSVSVVSGIINVLIAVIVSVYMLTDKPKLINNIKRIIYAVFPEDKADRLLVVSSECNKIFGNFIIGKMIDSLIIGCLCWIIMTVLGIPYSLVISVIVGITNMIPYFGPFIGAVPGILLLLIVDFYYALAFTILIIVLQQFDGLYLGPKILGESTGLRPIWIIFAITVGGAVAGVAGMFLGVPVTAVIAYLLDGFMEKKLKTRNVEFEKDPETDIISRDVLITEDKNL